MNDRLENVILVDRDDRPIGVGSKLDVHREGQLHRAFSVLIHDGEGRVLLQKRDKGKYHSGGLWTNACCGHPRPDEDTASAAGRRLREEMGFDCPLTPQRRLVYRADVGSGLTEHEFVHLFVGMWRGEVQPNPSEAEAYDWLPLQSAIQGATENPGRFTAWFQLYLEDIGRIGRPD